MRAKERLKIILPIVFFTIFLLLYMVFRWVTEALVLIFPTSRLEAQAQSPNSEAWHLDEVYLKIDGRMVRLWRAVDAEGEVLDVLVQSKRNKRAALRLMRKLLKKYGFVPDKLVTDDLRAYTMSLR